MAPVDPGTLMWATACEMIERAERLHRQFFHPIIAIASAARWEPPIDIIANDSEARIMVALPGVDRDDLKVTIDDDGVSVVGLRRQGTIPRDGTAVRLEIPYGRFERRIAFPTTGLRFGQSEYRNGCLALTFFKESMEVPIDG
ncbi:Hsp20/alpha crystallin family protein [Bradyrhizobium brasilense]|uniref:Hsp20/alpha crystallin family protein n=1 Tax=Bradyrhizobium brasilense TaxID=1419277 RepID=UPI0024B1D59F|nr:Hsp20/alpha crystallin family protein [Bradyrhizobium australafricanum]WFU34336.1 Hsp20/alpha crystallin family protein [Bradyrhizobium australafricanum]